MFWILWFMLSWWSLYMTLHYDVIFEDEASNALWVLLIIIGGPTVGIAVLITQGETK